VGIKVSRRWTGIKEKELSDIQFPEKCSACARSKGSSSSEKCDFCRKIDFPGSILCDLNRSVQEPRDFSCYAFLPLLEVATPISLEPGKSDSIRKGEKSQRSQDFQKTLSSDKFKYERALFLQQLNRDPDFVSVNLKFHFAWNVNKRRPLFFPEKEYFDFFHDTLLHCSDLAGGFSTLIWLAPDHVHVYVESDGEQSPETLLKRIKEFSEKEILSEFPALLDGSGPKFDLWDEAYFVETVG